MSKIAIIHSGMSTVEPVKKLFAEYYPEAAIFNIVDDSLAGRVLSAGSAAPDVYTAVAMYALSAQAAGCDALYNPCALIREAAEQAQALLHIPYFCNDVPMARKAIEAGERIALITANTPAMNHVSRMLRREIDLAGKKNVVNQVLCSEAFRALTQEKDRGKYARLMAEAVSRAAAENDVVILGQGSMYASDYPGQPVPVLDVHASGVLGLKELLEN